MVDAPAPNFVRSAPRFETEIIYLLSLYNGIHGLENAKRLYTTTMAVLQDANFNDLRTKVFNSSLNTVELIMILRVASMIHAHAEITLSIYREGE